MKKSKNAVFVRWLFVGFAGVGAAVVGFAGVNFNLVSDANAANAAKAVAKREPASAPQCKETAMEAVRFVDRLGWGEVESEPVKYVSGKRDQVRNEDFEIKSSVSGFTYKVSIQQDYRSEACIVISITT